jgi:Na+/H+ antiporter NhaD/arsenite permease-like protein
MWALCVLLAVLILIVLQPYLPWGMPVWLSMTLGAVLVLLGGSISGSQAWHAIDWNVIAYLFGTFIVGRALEDHAVLPYYADRWMRRPYAYRVYLAPMMLFFALASAVLMNDTVVLMVTPWLLLMARQQGVSAEPWCLALAYSVTIGAMLTPVGNPQNLFVALQSGMPQPFWHFVRAFAGPSLLALVFIYFMLLWRYRSVFARVHEAKKVHPKPCPKAWRSLRWSLLLLLVLMLLKALSMAWHWPYSLPFAAISLIAALPVVCGFQDRIQLMRRVDYTTLLFFVAMFILMKAVWLSAWVQHDVVSRMQSIHQPWLILVLSTLLSQVVSNVPAAALYLPLLKHAGASMHQWLALIVGLNVSGNLLMVGAASNLIIVQLAQKRGQRAFSAASFSLLGVPITLFCMLVYGWAAIY